MQTSENFNGTSWIVIRRKTWLVWRPIEQYYKTRHSSLWRHGMTGKEQEPSFSEKLDDLWDMAEARNIIKL